MSLPLWYCQHHIAIRRIATQHRGGWVESERTLPMNNAYQRRQGHEVGDHGNGDVQSQPVGPEFPREPWSTPVLANVALQNAAQP